MTLRRVSLSFPSREAAVKMLHEMVEEIEQGSDAQRVFEGDGGPDFVLEVVNEANDEFPEGGVATYGGDA